MRIGSDCIEGGRIDGSHRASRYLQERRDCSGLSKTTQVRSQDFQHLGRAEDLDAEDRAQVWRVPGQSALDGEERVALHYDGITDEPAIRRTEIAAAAVIQRADRRRSRAVERVLRDREAIAEMGATSWV